VRSEERRERVDLDEDPLDDIDLLSPKQIVERRADALRLRPNDDKLHLGVTIAKRDERLDDLVERSDFTLNEEPVLGGRPELRRELVDRRIGGE